MIVVEIFFAARFLQQMFQQKCVCKLAWVQVHQLLAAQPYNTSIPPLPAISPGFQRAREGAGCLEEF